MAIDEQARAGKVKDIFATLIISAFGFVAALFWNDAIKAMIAELVPAGQGWLWSIGSAVLVTVIAVIAILLVSRLVR